MQKKVKRSPSVKVPTTDSKGVKRSPFPLKVVEISQEDPLVISLVYAKKKVTTSPSVRVLTPGLNCVKQSQFQL